LFVSASGNLKMIVLEYEKTTTSVVRTSVPSYYDYDDSPLGQVVDFLLRDYMNNGLSVRAQLFMEDAVSVESAIRMLDEAYEKARKIAGLLGENK